MFGYEVLQSYNELEMLIYNYIMEHKEEVQFMTIRELSEAVHVSTSTIIRFCKKTGCDGYSEFRAQFKLFLKEEKKNKKKLSQDNGVDEIMYFLHTIASVYRGQHASDHVISPIFCVILSQRTFSTPPSSALKIGEIPMAEVEESETVRFVLLQGT